MPRTLADVIRDQAKDSLKRGEAAVASGELGWARAWFERARRLLPADPTVLLSLAGVLLQTGDPAAAKMFAEASAKVDMREVWLGLAAAALQAGDRATARSALQAMLSRHVLPADTGSVARMAGAVSQDGWCGVGRVAGGGGLLCITDTPGAIIRVDGVRCKASPLPTGGRRLTVMRKGVALLGSPIELGRIRRVEGVVAAAQGGLAGWAWLPCDADTDPWITVTDTERAGSTTLRVRATGGEVAASQPMTRPRGFAIAAADLAAFRGPVRVVGEDGRDLAGSPLDPNAPMRAAMQVARLAALECPAVDAVPSPAATFDLSAPADILGPPARAVAALQRPVAIVMPAYRGRALTAACLASVFETCPADTAIIVVDDASPEPDLAADLDRLAEAGRIILIRHAVNQGFPAAANAGLRAAFALQPEHDALLLNSDTLLPTGPAPSWLARLRAAVHAAPDIGTAAPFSNDATILSYPDRDGANIAPGAAALRALDAMAMQANAGESVDIPTSVGFCMYLRRECAIETGLFRPSLFAQGYGEENDFCIRARHLGWRHVAVPGVFVVHCASTSFGAARSPLVARNLAVLEQLHPGYHALIAAYQRAIPAEDALAPARLRLDALRWRAEAREGAVLLVTHDTGGGVERVVRGRAREIAAAGLRPIVLRPVHDPDSEGGFMPGLCRVEDGVGAPGFPNLVFRLPDELPILAEFLRPDRPALLELHHRLGHHPSIAGLAEALALPVELRVHDYASFCPRVTLLGFERRYCGEPVDLAACEACVADAGSRLGEEIGVAELRARSTAEFAAARRVVVPSADMAGRLRRHFPQLRAEVQALENDVTIAPPPPPRTDQPVRIVVIGGIGVEKGFDVLLACARDAAQRRLPLEFRLVGHSTDDARLIDTGRVFVTGRYDEAEALDLIRAQGARLAFLPSIWPETWGFTLGLAWRAGLHAAVFEIGAMAARIRATGHGVLLPLGLPTAALNHALIHAQPASLAAAPQLRLSTAANTAV